MKTFSKLEKRILEKIIRIHHSSELDTTANILGGSDNVFDFEHFYLCFESNEVYEVHFFESYYENVLNEDDSSVLDSISETILFKIIKIINFFDYLEEHKYISVKKTDLNKFFTIECDDVPDLDKVIRLLINNIITPLNRLKILRDNNYLTDKEIVFLNEKIKTKKRKSLFRASAAVTMSGLLLMTSISYSNWKSTNINASYNNKVELEKIRPVISEVKNVSIEVKEKPDKKISVVNVKRLNIRKKNSVKSKNVGKLFLDDEVEIVQRNGDWVLVGQYENNKLIVKGWVLLIFLKNKNIL